MYDVLIWRKNPYRHFWREYETKELAEKEKDRLLTTPKYQSTLIRAEVIPAEENPHRRWLIRWPDEEKFFV